MGEDFEAAWSGAQDSPEDSAQGKAFDLAIPTPEHYYPLLYALALQGKDERATLFNDKPVAGSLTMTSVKIDKA